MWKWFRLAKRVSELEDLMLKLSRTVADRDLDWVDMRARVKRMLDRTEKAAQRQEQGVESGNSLDAPQDGEGVAVHDGHPLTARQKAIQQQILRRRAGLS